MRQNHWLIARYWAAFGLGSRNDLPIVSEGLALGQRGDKDGDKGDDEEDTDGPQANFVAHLPEALCHALEELGDGEFGHPDAGGQN